MTEPEAVVLSRIIRAPCASVFEAWTDPAMLRLWLAPGANVVEHAEADPKVGGRFLLRTAGPDGARHRISGLFRAFDPDRHLALSWIYDGPLDLLNGEETLLEIDLTAIDPGATELRLTHHRIARADVREAYRGDWPSCFDKLEATLS